MHSGDKWDNQDRLLVGEEGDGVIYYTQWVFYYD